MAPNRPSSPDSLLWAHQLKREHNLLLQHIQKIEAALQDQSTRLGQIEHGSVSKNDTAFDTLSQRITVLEANGNINRLTAVEHQAKSDIRSLQSQQTGIQRQIETLQSESENASLERQKVADQGQLLLKRVDDLEAGLKIYERSLAQLGEELNQPQIQFVRSQMAMLVQLVEKNDTQLGTLQQSVQALEMSYDVLTRQNEELDTKIKNLAGQCQEVIPKSTERPGRPKRTAAIHAALALDSQTKKKKSLEGIKNSEPISQTRAAHGRFLKADNRASPRRLWKSHVHFLADVENGIAAKEQSKDQSSNFMQADFELPINASRRPRASANKGNKSLPKGDHNVSKNMVKTTTIIPATPMDQDVQPEPIIPPRRTILQPSQSTPGQTQPEKTRDLDVRPAAKAIKPATNKANAIRSDAMVTRAAARRQLKQQADTPAEPDILASPMSSSPPPEQAQHALTPGQIQPETPKGRVVVEPTLPETPHPRMASLRKRPEAVPERRQILQYDTSSSP